MIHQVPPPRCVPLPVVRPIGGGGSPPSPDPGGGGGRPPGSPPGDSPGDEPGGDLKGAKHIGIPTDTKKHVVKSISISIEVIIYLGVFQSIVI